MTLTLEQFAVVGRMVHYVLPAGLAKASSVGAHRPAVIVRVYGSSNKVNLQVFTDGKDDGIQLASGLCWRTEVENDPEGAQGTWHWIE